MDFSWIFICGKNLFSARQPSVLFSPKLCVLNCALLAIHHCLFGVQKIRNQKFLAIQMWKSNVNFISYYFFEQRAFKHIFAFVLMQMCVCLKEHMRVDFCALDIVCLGSTVSWNRQGCNRQSMQRVQNTWLIGTGLRKCSDINVVVQTAIFLILVVRNNKTSSGIDGKTRDCLFRNCLYYRYLQLRFC